MPKNICYASMCRQSGGGGGVDYEMSEITIGIERFNESFVLCPQLTTINSQLIVIVVMHC